MNKDNLNFNGKIWAILRNEKTGEEIVFNTKNIVTNAGDVYYAQLGAGEATDNTFTTLYLGDSSSSAPGKANTLASVNQIASSSKAKSSGYPKTNDADADNTGAGTNVITWTFEYAAGDGNFSGITDGAISITGATGTDPLLCHFEFASSFNKDSNTTLKVIVNHTATGV